MNSTQIKCLISLGKTLSFTKSAKDLYLSQSTVSKNIHGLEKELDVKLISNVHKKLELTNEGKCFYRAAVKVDNELSNTILKIKQSSKINNNRVIIGFSNIPFEQKYLPLFIKKMNKTKQWGIQLKSTNVAKLDDIEMKLRKRDLNFMLYQEDFFNKNEFDFSPLISAGFSVIVRKNSALAQLNRIPISKLAKHKIYLWNGKVPLKSVSLLYQKIQMYLGDEASQIEIINKASFAKILVSSESGIAIVPSFVYDHDNSDLCYKYLDCDITINYGIGYLKSEKKQKYFKNITSKLKEAILMAKNEWN
ncbi:LysR family transcriptional regulator [Lactobacillus sp. ESL0731]|uniref:LysR family transcriptional regulator n=1 Tax=unclassified Lactobacillus TaxID=2620435 RepID=UPI0023F864C2|nr:MULTISPECIES: LysR family transcriptional regulator [unclassified Lactobacillus]WEV51097.1 LysR family transcriptional regulator [Lactobacillus sp. ESL0700]WEV62226.1 LysR family transcriptional regulator [Lactobacillus sp. ESL0731]